MWRLGHKKDRRNINDGPQASTNRHHPTRGKRYAKSVEESISLCEPREDTQWGKINSLEPGYIVQ